MTGRTWLFVCAVLLAVSSGAAMMSAAQPRRAPVVPSLPPIVMTCPHHPDVVEDEPGTCPQCRMALVPSRIDTAWMCPVHAAVTETAEGTCRLCRRTLVPVTVTLSWSCRGEASVEHLNPGPCADGTPRMARRVLRPHGNHNTQHGGQFFMAPDNWHHLEGAYPRAGVFRLYLYDDYARTLSGERMRSVTARVVTKETFDPASRKTTEHAAFPLTVIRNGDYLEARVDTRALPAAMTAKVRFAPGAPEYRFDFTFPSLSEEPAVPVAASAAPRMARTLPPLPAASPPAETEAAAAPSQTVPEMLVQLRMRSLQTRELIRRGDFAAVWIPAFAAKELAVLLEPRTAHLEPAAQAAAAPALHDVVRGAWALDATADAGNRQQIEEAYTAFGAAVERARAAFGEAR